MSFRARTFVGCVVVALLGGQTMASDVPHLHTSVWEIDKHVDDVRYVKSAVAANSFTGDWKIEFMAERSDLQDTRERWTVVIERGQEFADMSTYVYIDGEYQYASILATTDGKLFYTISMGDMSETVALDGSATQSELEAVAALINETRATADVVQAVLSGGVEQLGLQELSQCDYTYETCIGNCKADHPHWDQPCEGDPMQDQEVQCIEEYLCCLDKAAYIGCARSCWCDFCDTEHADVRDCYEEADLYEYLVAHSCGHDFADCLGFSFGP